MSFLIRRVVELSTRGQVGIGDRVAFQRSPRFDDDDEREVNAVTSVKRNRLNEFTALEPFMATFREHLGLWRCASIVGRFIGT